MSALHRDWQQTQALRTWGDGTRCDECCNGDRCDDTSHYERAHCPHCKGTGWALWTPAGRADFLAHMKRMGLSEEEARAAIAKATGARP